MTDTITVTGLVATSPKHLVTAEGLPISSFRLASTQRRFDRNEKKWVDGDTNWFTVTAFRQLALNIIGSVDKGQRVVVSGRLRVRDWTSETRSGTNVEIDADAIGHDLAWGTAAYTRNIGNAAARTDEATGDASSAAGHEEPGAAAWHLPELPETAEVTGAREPSDESGTRVDSDELAVPF